MSYRPGLPNVLHSLNLSINAGEKIGIVGRTGMLLCWSILSIVSILVFYFRRRKIVSHPVSSPNCGVYRTDQDRRVCFPIRVFASLSLYLDSVNISEIGLKDLRTKIAIIPQDVRYTCFFRPILAADWFCLAYSLQWYVLIPDASSF